MVPDKRASLCHVALLQLPNRQPRLVLLVCLSGVHLHHVRPLQHHPIPCRNRLVPPYLSPDDNRRRVAVVAISPAYAVSISLAAPPAMGDLEDDGQRSARNNCGAGEGAAPMVKEVEGWPF